MATPERQSAPAESLTVDDVKDIIEHLRAMQYVVYVEVDVLNRLIYFVGTSQALFHVRYQLDRVRGGETAKRVAF